MYDYFVHFRMVGIFLGWALFIFIAYKTSQVEIDFKDFDPYAELGIDRVRMMLTASFQKLSFAGKLNEGFRFSTRAVM